MDTEILKVKKLNLDHYFVIKIIIKKGLNASKVPVYYDRRGIRSRFVSTSQPIVTASVLTFESRWLASVGIPY